MSLYQVLINFIYVTYGAITRFEVGKPAWYFYGYDFMGVDSKTGEPIFRDIDGVEGITG